MLMVWLREIYVVFRSERKLIRGSAVVCPPGGQEPKLFEDQKERDWSACFIGLGG